MSLPSRRNVSKIVEKYRREFPDLERPLLRRLIRAENKIVNPSELRKLSRYLKKAYEVQPQPKRRELKPQPEENKFHILTAEELYRNQEARRHWKEKRRFFHRVKDPWKDFKKGSP